MAAQGQPGAVSRARYAGDHALSLAGGTDKLDVVDAERAKASADSRRDGSLVAGRVRARRRNELSGELDKIVPVSFDVGVYDALDGTRF